jgi:MFS family permease
MEQQFRVYSYRWVVLAIYMYVSALTQLYWLNFAAIETFIEDLLKIPASDVMWFTLVFPLIQVILTLPAGLIIDKKGFKFGIGLGAVFTGVFALFRVINPTSFAILLISQIGISIGQPFVLNGITKLATSWFSPKEEATAVGLGSLSLFVGMMIALGATPWLVEGFGFSAMIWIYGIMGIVGMLAFLFFTREMPPTPARASETLEELTSWGSIKHILKMRDFVILGFVALVGIGVFNGLATWLEKILNEVHNMPMTDAGNISAALILSGMIGCFVIPLISDKIGRRKPFLILASLVGALAVTAFIFAKSYGLNMLNGVLIGFFLISALPIMLTMSAEITGLRYAGVSVGYLQLLGNAAAVVLVAAMESLRGSTGVLLSSENVPLIVQ